MGFTGSSRIFYFAQVLDLRKNYRIFANPKLEHMCFSTSFLILRREQTWEVWADALAN